MNIINCILPSRVPCSPDRDTRSAPPPYRESSFLKFDDALRAMSVPRTPEQEARERAEEKLKQIDVVVSKKLRALEECRSRLGTFASKRLSDQFDDVVTQLRAIPVSVAPWEDPERLVPSVQEFVERMWEPLEAETHRNVENMAKFFLQTVDIPALGKIFGNQGATPIPDVQRGIEELLTELVVTGKTAKAYLKMCLGQQCEVKCRYRDKQIQVLVKEPIPNAGMKSVWKVTILSGPVGPDGPNAPGGSFGKVFAYAKPKKMGPDQSLSPYEEAWRGEVLYSDALQRAGVRHMLHAEKVFRKKGKPGEVKGLASEWHDCGNASRLVHQSLAPCSLPHEWFVNRLIISLQVAQALSDMHEHGVLHGDMKPGNVFLQFTPQKTLKATLADFGSACQIGTLQKGRIGTPPYVAPEQWVGFETGWEATGAIDMWPFGLFLLRLFRSKVEVDCVSYLFSKGFENFTPSEWQKVIANFRKYLLENIDAEYPLDSLFEMLLREDPRDRPSASEVVSWLHEIIRLEFKKNGS